jgi:asparagine synthase (glutamine-hydrolysing)
MCGIAGFVGDPEAGRPALDRALSALRHRGPDDEGVEVFAANGAGRAVGLGNRRLAVLDLSAAGHQPMTSADGRFTIVFNGEIYSHLELRDELTRRGRSVRSSSDTEVLVEAWSEWGADVLPRLVGMFAIAVHDRRTNELVLARDCFGIKPLFFGNWRGGFAFASEVRALLEFPGLDRSVNAGRLFTFLTSLRSDYGGESMFAGIAQVPPAHYLTVSEDGVASVPVRYWRAATRTRDDLTMDAAAERTRELFLDSVRGHLRSDVPIGFALSGGLDSSAVICAARQLLGPEAPLHTFSFIPRHPLINETRFSEEVARETRSISHAFTLEAEDLASDFDALTDAQGEPISSPVVYAQHRVFGRARDEGITVLLTGEGADELLAGYDGFVAARAVSLIRSGRVGAAVRLLRLATPVGGSRRHAARSVLRRMLPTPFVAAVRALRGLPAGEGWLNRAWFADRGVVPAGPRPSNGGSTLIQDLEEAVEVASLPALLRFQDRNAMAFSIENRVPFLTSAFADFALSLPKTTCSLPRVLARRCSGVRCAASCPTRCSSAREDRICHPGPGLVGSTVRLGGVETRFDGRSAVSQGRRAATPMGERSA